MFDQTFLDGKNKGKQRNSTFGEIFIGFALDSFSSFKAVLQ